MRPHAPWFRPNICRTGKANIAIVSFRAASVADPVAVIDGEAIDGSGVVRPKYRGKFPFTLSIEITGNLVATTLQVIGVDGAGNEIKETKSVTGGDPAISTNKAFAGVRRVVYSAPEAGTLNIGINDAFGIGPLPIMSTHRILYKTVDDVADNGTVTPASSQNNKDAFGVWEPEPWAGRKKLEIAYIVG